MKIDFYVYNTHEIIVWENIIRALIGLNVDAKYILEAPILNKAEGTISNKHNNWVDDKSSELQKLMTDDIFAHCSALITSLKLPVEYESRYGADAVVSTQGVGWFDKYEGLKFRTMYGVGATKNSYGHGVVNIGFDAIFSHGQFSKNEIGKITGNHKIYVSGFPKWAPFFRNELNKVEISSFFGLNEHKKNLVYIPTWAQSSSLDKFWDNIIQLSSNFNLIIKPHHNNYHFEAERIENLLQNPHIFKSNELNLMHYYAIADAIITDVRSGGFTEALLVDSPIIGLSPNENSEDDYLIKNIEKVGKIVRNKEENFIDIVESAIDEHSNNSARRFFKNLFFEDLNGNDDLFTANKMVEILDSKKFVNIPKSLSDENQVLISVLIPTYNRREILKLTLDSLENQNLNKNLYEVIVIDDGSSDDTVEFLQNFSPSMNFKYVSQENSGPARARNNGIGLSRGKYLLFLNDDAVCDSKLLDVHLHFHKQFEKIKLKTAVLGRFDYLEDDVDKLFMNLLNKSTLIFAYSEMNSNNFYAWNYFWTCNLSILKSAVIDVGMFDEDFREPMMEDIELGLRLSMHGYNIFFTEQAVTHHHHTISLDSFLRRQEMLGRNTVKLLRKHLIDHLGDLFIFGIEKLDENVINLLKSKTENNDAYALELYNKIKIFENIRYSEHKFIKLNGERRSFEEVQDIVYRLVNEINHFYYYKGIIAAYNELEENMEMQIPTIEEKKMLFSVIIPTYNRAEILWKCLNSFCDQNFDFNSFEVIVINDGSTDYTERVVNDFSAPYSLKYIFQQNSGPAAARNKGIGVAKGEFLLFVNDDTIAEQNLLLEHYKVHSISEQFPPDNKNFAVLGTFDYAPEVKNKPFVNFLEQTALVFAYPIMKNGHLYPYRFFWTCNLSIKKAAVESVGMFDESFKEAMGEDTDLGYRLEALGYKVYYHSGAISWHDHAMNVHNFTKRQQMSGRNMVKLFNKHKELLLKEKNLFGFEQVDDYLIREFKNFIQASESECNRAISLIEDIDKIDIFNPNFIPIQDNYIVTVNDIVKLIDKHIKIVHEYYFKLGIIEGFEALSNEKMKINIQVEKLVNKPKIVDSALRAFNSVSKKSIVQAMPLGMIADKLTQSIIDKFEMKEDISEKIEVIEIKESASAKVEEDYDDFDYLSILSDKPIDYSEFDLPNSSEVHSLSIDNNSIAVEENSLSIENNFIAVEENSLSFDNNSIAVENNSLSFEEIVDNSEQIPQLPYPKRVLITMFGWNESGGGTMFPKEVAKRYADLGIETTVFFAGLSHPKTATPYFLEKQTDGNLTLYGLYNRTGYFLLGEHPDLEIVDERVLFYYNQVLESVKPDVVHFHNFLGLSFKIAEATFLKGIKSFYTPHNYYFIDPNLYMIKSNLKVWENSNFFENSELLKTNPTKIKLYEQRVSAARNTINQYIDYTLAISAREKEILVDFGAIAEKIFVVHQAPLFTEMNLKKHFEPILERPVKFGFIGTAIPHKGVHKLVVAAQILDKERAEIHIYGNGNELYRKELMKIDHKGICVWHGEYKTDDLAEILDNLDCVVVPSIWEEAAGLVVLESLSYGVPVIGARIGGIPDFIEDNYNGRTYPANSERNLASILYELSMNPDILDRYKRNCGKEFRFSDYIKHTLSLYSKAINNEELSKAESELIYRKRI